MPPAAILDIDGTLVDTNYHHAIAWYRAFRQHELIVPLWRIHRAIGMGSDFLVEHLVGKDKDEELGDSIRAAEGPLYLAFIEEAAPLEGARGLIEDLKERGSAVILASSAKGNELDHYLDLLDARDLADGWTSADDVEQSKPEPDLVNAALEKAGTREAVMVGDTPWDIEAAKKADVPTIAVRTGGFGVDELQEAGAAVVFESIQELRERIGETPLG
jgi:HAD superfamily hydrolase (TIGR01509 family)